MQLHVPSLEEQRYRSVETENIVSHQKYSLRENFGGAWLQLLSAYAIGLVYLLIRLLSRSIVCDTL